MIAFWILRPQCVQTSDKKSEEKEKKKNYEKMELLIWARE